MHKTLAVAMSLALAISAAASGEVFARSCRDAKGKFMTCPPAAASNHCRDIKTKKFAKCGGPGTEPAPMKPK
jgi:hypothetical protein